MAAECMGEIAMQLLRRRSGLLAALLAVGFALGAWQASFKELPDSKIFRDLSD